MSLRTVVFWIHLTCGLAAGSVILLMSATGVLLVYQKQLEEWADRRYWTAPAAPGERAPLSQLIASAGAYQAGAEVASVMLYADPSAPAAVSIRGGPTLYLDPSTAQVRGEAPAAMRSFFRAVIGWHRWFNVGGEGRAAARAVTGWSNVLFLFLVLSGLYLWFPRRWRWQHFRPVLFFNTRARGKARDFNWHHVLGFWMSLPLALVVASATVISFPWASELVYRSMGEEPPRRPATRAAPTAAASVGEESGDWGARPFDARALDGLVEPATSRIERWRTVVFSVPEEPDGPVQVRVDQGWGGQPQLRHTLTFDAASGRETAYSGFAEQSRGQRLRSYLRFAHTGEFHGLWGQTVAGLASLAGVFLVWTGFSLACRRLVVPLVRRNGA